MQAAVSSPTEVASRSVFATWSEVLRLTFRRPGLLLPFAILAAAELYVLIIIVDTPLAFKGWLDAFIARQYGPAYANYPFKTAILPSLMWTARLILEVAVGSLMTAWVTARVVFLVRREQLGLWGALRTVASRYLVFAALQVLVIIAVRLASRLIGAGFSQFGAKEVMSPQVGVIVFISSTFSVLTLISAALIFTIPAMINGRIGLFRGLGVSVKFFLRRPISSFLLVAVPGIPYFLFSAIVSLAPSMGAGGSPHRTANLLLGGIVAAYVARYLMTAGAAVTFGERTQRGNC